MKYIDAETLEANLDEHYRKYQSKYMETRNPYTQGLIDALDLAEQVINSLQQEQPEVDFEKEINKAMKSDLCPEEISDYDFCRIARHFYELGLRRAAEMYDEIEYNRQQEEENT